MSWLFSRALVAEYSGATCSDGEQCAPLNVMPTQHKFWRNDKTMESSDLSRFGLTCAVLTESHGAELLTWYLAGFPARTLARPEKALELGVLEAASGNTWRGLFATYSPDTSMWKTLQCSLLEDSGEFLETWPRWGLMRSGESYLLPTPELRTYGSGYGFWPTPTVNGNYNRPGASATSGWGLSSAVRMWPTPCASDKSDRQIHGPVHISKTGLPKHIAPNGMKSQMRLSQAVKLYPTPTTMKSGGGPALNKWGGSGARKKMATMVSHQEMNGPLNPEWVEWLMGWPVGWSDLTPLGMDKFREWRQQHGECWEAAE